MRTAPIRWSETDVNTITEWFCRRDEAGNSTNYDAWTISSYTDVAKGMLEETGLENKPLATAKKATDKL